MSSFPLCMITAPVAVQVVCLTFMYVNEYWNFSNTGYCRSILVAGFVFLCKQSEYSLTATAGMFAPFVARWLKSESGDESMFESQKFKKMNSELDQSRI